MAVQQDFDFSDGIFSGDDIVLDWYVETGPEIEVDAAAAAGATSITVKPLEETIASGAKVRIGLIPGVTAGIVVTLTAEAKYGTTSLSVSATTGAFRQGQKGRRCQNVTGFTMAMSVTSPPSTTDLLPKEVTAVTADEGHIRATLTDDDTGTTLSARGYKYRTRRTDAGNERTMAEGTLRLR